MKKLILTAAVATFGLANSALADTVQITSLTSFSTPSHTLNSEATFAFAGTPQIIFQVAGKQCTFTGSASGSVPMGCNYAITVQPDGSVSGILTAGNNVCTQSSQIAASCN